MSKVLQHLVSKQKKRLVVSGFDLDLTYITDQVIAMGLPASGVTGMYRNPQSEVIRFLETFHGGQYKIYNLCTRKQDQYDPDAFGGSVCSYPFEDHGVPPLKMVQALAHSVQSWLAPSRDRVVCIHCLAGKGRTGLMVCAAMMQMGLVRSARESMAFYGERRMKNKKGVTQSSQRRWVEYYEQMLSPTLGVRVMGKRRMIGCALPGSTAAISVQLQAVDDVSGHPHTVFDSGLFTERCEMSWEFVEDACVVLTDDEGKPIAQMWLHAAMIGGELLETSIKWWDVERKNKSGKKLLKAHGVQLRFADDEGGFEGAGQTLPPITDKEYRKQCPGEYDELDPGLNDNDDDDDDDDRFLHADEVDEEAMVREVAFQEQGAGGASRQGARGTVTDEARRTELEQQLASRRSRLPNMGWLSGMLRPSAMSRKTSGSNASASSSSGGEERASQQEAWFSKNYSPLQDSKRASMQAKQRASLPAEGGLETIPSEDPFEPGSAPGLQRGASTPAAVGLPMVRGNSETEF